MVMKCNLRHAIALNEMIIKVGIVKSVKNIAIFKYNYAYA